MRTISLPSVIVLVVGTWAGAAPADAQTPVCPDGYYYSDSDGQCYPDQPVYDVAPPVYLPPVVFDGYGIGLGGGGGRGGIGRGGGGRGGGGGGRGGGGRGGGSGRR